MLNYTDIYCINQYISVDQLKYYGIFNASLTINVTIRDYKMKKQLLIAAVATSMSLFAIADISLSGKALLYGDEDQSKAILYKDKDKLIEADVTMTGVTLTGKSGDTSFAITYINNAGYISARDIARTTPWGVTFEATYTETKASGSMGSVSVSTEVLS